MMAAAASMSDDGLGGYYGPPMTGMQTTSATHITRSCVAVVDKYRPDINFIMQLTIHICQKYIGRLNWSPSQCTGQVQSVV